jgi:hypothetical protein
MHEQLQTLRSDPELLKLMKNTRPMSADEIFEQRVSWVYGTIKSDWTKDQVREFLKTM